MHDKCSMVERSACISHRMASAFACGGVNDSQRTNPLNMSSAWSSTAADRGRRPAHGAIDAAPPRHTRRGATPRRDVRRWRRVLRSRRGRGARGRRHGQRRNAGIGRVRHGGAPMPGVAGRPGCPSGRRRGGDTPAANPPMMGKPRSTGIDGSVSDGASWSPRPTDRCASHQSWQASCGRPRRCQSPSSREKGKSCRQSIWQMVDQRGITCQRSECKWLVIDVAVM